MKLVKIISVVGGIAFMLLKIAPLMGTDTDFWIVTGVLAFAIYGLVSIIDDMAAWAWKNEKRP